MIRCQSCGRQNENHYRFCLGCGTPLGQGRKPAAAPARPEGEPGWSLGEGGAGDEAENGWSLGSPDGRAAPERSAWAMPASGPAKPAPTARGQPGRPRAVEFAPTAAAMPAATPPQGQAPVPRPRPDLEPRPVGTDPGFAPQGAASGSSPGSPAKNGAPTGRRCTQCGSAIPPDFSFCGRCGARFDEGKAGEPAGARTMYLSGAGPDADRGPALGRLLVLRADGTVGEEIELPAGDTMVGRDAGIPFLAADRLLSPRHALFSFRGTELYVSDQDSLNGVFCKLSGEHPLRSGEVFRIGQQLLRYEDAKEIEQLIAPPAGEETYVLGSPDLGYWGRLVQIVTRDRIGNAYLLAGQEVTLGRERAQITFPHDGFVSATHASVVRRGEQPVLVDRGSSNGTYLRISEERALSSGDLILLGQNLLRVELLT